MKLTMGSCIRDLSDAYVHSLHDDGDFVASEMNAQCNGDYWRYDADEGMIVTNYEAMAKADHIRVEYDVGYRGGDYSHVGKFAYIPVPYVTWFGTVEDAFHAVMSLDQSCIVHYSQDDLYDSNGNLRGEE